MLQQHQELIVIGILHAVQLLVLHIHHHYQLLANNLIIVVVHLVVIVFQDKQHVIYIQVKVNVIWLMIVQIINVDI